MKINSFLIAPFIHASLFDYSSSKTTNDIYAIGNIA